MAATLGRFRSMTWAGRPIHTLMLPACAIGIALVAYLASTLARDVYHGIPSSIAVSAIEPSCLSAVASTGCTVDYERLNPGRFYLRTRGRAASVTIVVRDHAPLAGSRALLVRAEEVGRLTIDSDESRPDAAPITHEISKARTRTVISLPQPTPAWNRITFAPTSPEGEVVIRELGFFATDRDLLRSARQPFPSISGASFYSTVAAAVTLAVCALVVLAVWTAPREMYRPVPWLLTLLCLSVCILELGTIFSPYWSFDLRSFYGEELILSPLGGNVTGSLQEGSRLTQGLGQTIAPGFVQWHRMPGYGWLCALAAVMGRTTDMVEIAMIVVLLQVVLYSAAVGLFVSVGRRVFGLPIAASIGVLITLLPKQLNLTEVDSIIAPISLVVLAALLVSLSQSSDGATPSMRTFLLVNAACALWFVLRNDVLPGWVVLSIALAGRRWWRLVVPVVLMASIALPWAFYKRQYRHEFNLMPTNTGEVLLLSLCEAPGAFPYECTDHGYFEWARRAGHADIASQAASNLAVAEVVRHWVTYPVHFGFMVWFKLRRCLLDQSWPGFRTRINLLYSGTLRDLGLFVVLLAVVTMAIAVDHARRRTLLLGWVLFLNMPLFFIVFTSAGRFYAAAGVSLLVTAIPLLFERGLYSSIKRYPWRAAFVIACFALFIVEGRRVEDWVRTDDAVHYWAPFLNPHDSSLEFVGH
jgi:hypothetical protein